MKKIFLLLALTASPCFALPNHSAVDPLILSKIELAFTQTKEAEVPFPLMTQVVADMQRKQKQRDLEDVLLEQTKGRLSRDALRFAMEARACAIRNDRTQNHGSRLTIIDFGLPSSEKRLFIVDLEDEKLILKDWVAHGAGSGGLYATRFSNTPDSHMSSLGLIEPMFKYEASSGPAMRLRGLEKGINDNIYDRHIIVHQSTYIGDGRTGRSQGCQAVRPEAIDVFINGLSGGLMYAYHPQFSPFLNSDLLSCGEVLSSEDFMCTFTPPPIPEPEEIIQTFLTQKSCQQSWFA